MSGEIVKTADFWNAVEGKPDLFDYDLKEGEFLFDGNLDGRMKKVETYYKWIKPAKQVAKAVGVVALFGLPLLAGCLGQAPTPEPTHTPEPTSTPTITAVPTTLPPTTSPPITVSPTPTGTPKPQEVSHWGIYVPDTPELRKSDAYNLYQLFLTQLKDNDKSDMPFFTENVKFHDKNKTSDYGIYNEKTWEKAKNGGLQKLGLPEGVVDEIIEWVEKYKYYSIYIQVTDDSKSPYSVFFVIPSGYTPTHQGLDETATLDQLKTEQYRPWHDASKVKDKILSLKPDEYPFFFIVPDVNANAFITYMQSI